MKKIIRIVIASMVMLNVSIGIASATLYYNDPSWIGALITSDFTALELVEQEKLVAPHPFAIIPGYEQEYSCNYITPNEKISILRIDGSIPVVELDDVLAFVGKSYPAGTQVIFSDKHNFICVIKDW